MVNGRDPGLAEKPKVEKLQMDWLRSEDLNEEKNVTASTVIIAVWAHLPYVAAERPSLLPIGRSARGQGGSAGV
jgi:hypothetical protein